MVRCKSWLKTRTEALKGRDSIAEGNALGLRQRYRQALKGRNPISYFALSGLVRTRARTGGDAALCPRLLNRAPSGLLFASSNILSVIKEKLFAGQHGPSQILNGLAALRWCGARHVAFSQYR